MTAIRLGLQPKDYKSQSDKRISHCIIIGAITMALHLVTVLLYTEHNHIIFLILNILADIGCCVFILIYSEFMIRPVRKLYLLSAKEKEKVCGMVSEISSETIRHMGLDCYEVIIEDRKYFLPANTITLKTHETICGYVTSHVLMEVSK